MTAMRRLFELRPVHGTMGWITTIWAETREDAVRAFERHLGAVKSCVEKVVYRGCLVDRETAEQMQKATHAPIEVPYGVEGIRV